MARIRQHLHYSDTRAELVEHKDARRGACEDAFWDETELVDYQASPAKRKAPRKKRGCPENDFKEHVYVWVTEVRTLWTDNTYTAHFKTCCGCGKIDKRRYDW